MTGGDPQPSALVAAAGALAAGEVDAALDHLNAPLGSSDPLVRGAALFLRALAFHRKGDDSVAVASLCSALEVWGDAAPRSVATELAGLAAAVHRQGATDEAVRLLAAARDVASGTDGSLAAALDAELIALTSATGAAARTPSALRPLVVALGNADFDFAAREVDSFIDSPPQGVPLATFLELLDRYAASASAPDRAPTVQVQLDRLADIIAATIPGPEHNAGELLAASAVVETMRLRLILGRASALGGDDALAVLAVARRSIGTRTPTTLAAAVHLAIATSAATLADRLTAGLEAGRLAIEVDQRREVAAVLGVIGDEAARRMEWTIAVTAQAAALTIHELIGDDEMARAMRLILAAAETAADRHGLAATDLEAALRLARALREGGA